MNTLERLRAKVRVPLPVVYITLAILTGLAYAPARDVMVTGHTWLYIIESNITLNFVLLFFMWGIISDKLTKNRSKHKQWLVFFAGVVLLILFFKFVGGYETLFG